MGCVSSKLVKKKLVREIRVNNGGDHIVSLTSTTYGHLDLDQQRPETSQELTKGEAFEPRRSTAREDDPEIINTWELMEDLEDSTRIISPKSRGILSWKTPAKPSLESPKRNGSSKRFRGKENRGLSPNQIPKRGVMRLSFPLKTEEGSAAVTQRRKSFSPAFDPDLVASYERELSQEKEQIKMVISSSGKTERNRESERILEGFPEKCPPGGEDSVVVYITTLRGIRKTFEDCNAVRSVLDSHEVRFSERDVSMHSVFKEEIRGILGTKQVKIPAVFVKGRMVDVMKLEEEGKLGILLECMPKQRLGGGCCCGCGGMRFVMCDVCNGSCKVMDGEKKNNAVVKCLVCNENGLVLCPICS
ncbi:Glutaredoxin family protein [Raphanus sativus]|uniref:Uncharacterized protein At3g28850 n=1 Tax=Raphanus sativus TaxID=3726 RepID=A0A6J0MQ69_RAPSA|nr:uncharacterized protein At3g28850 [Raphanus sativus]XP_056857965.1 uncharacterized protein At3g28850-like [Raphanus sativus]KAJ4866104.1 Glutaredoxin family protein [Raphanus sativus]KAJ4908845.1 Glutaredoxin family protein [Raphanus sativus]